MSPHNVNPSYSKVHFRYTNIRQILVLPSFGGTMIVHELFIQHSENISIPNEVHYTRQDTINVDSSKT